MKYLPLLLLMMEPSGRAQTVDAARGFEHFYNLEYEEAIREFRALAGKSPDNPNVQNHIAQSILYHEMFKAGALESELVSGGNPFINRPKVNASAEASQQFEQAIGRAMELAKARIAQDARDVMGLYALGVSHGLKANYSFLVKKAWREALRDGTEARKLHMQVIAIDPGYADARLVLGVHDYVVGSLPWHWKMLGFLAGFRGNREEGLKTLRMVGERGKLNKWDAQVLLAAVYRRARRAKEAIPLLAGLIRQFPRNYLFRLELAQMYGDAGDKTQAYAVLDAAEKLKVSNAPGFGSLPLEKILYYKANLLFWYKDLEGALGYLERVTPRAAELDKSTHMMAWMRLGQVYDLKGDRGLAVEAYKRAAAVLPESEVAKESRAYMSSPYKRKA